jgi:hypothetical protein
MATPRKTMAIALSPDERTRLKIYCVRENIPQQELLRKLLLEHLEKCCA